jgi:hypothetical protein
MTNRFLGAYVTTPWANTFLWRMTECFACSKRKKEENQRNTAEQFQLPIAKRVYNFKVDFVQ